MVRVGGIRCSGRRSARGCRRLLEPLSPGPPFGFSERKSVTPEDAVLKRIRTRSIVIAGLCALAAFGFGWKASLSLTICAAVVILSFLVFEKLTARLLFAQEKRAFRRKLPLLLVTGAGLVFLGMIFPWKAFDPTAGLVGLSVVVLAIGAEVFEGMRKA